MKRALLGGIGILALLLGAEQVNAQARITAHPGGWEWYASVGPVRRGTDCVADVDVNRGYGFLKPCPAPKAAAKPVTVGWEWAASVGPSRRGASCVADVDVNRGYGYLKPCPKPKP